MKNTTVVKAATLIAVCISLSACGGGSSVAPVTPPVTPSIANAQGFWSANLSNGSSASAVILPNGQAWVVYQTGSNVTALAQASLSLNGTTYSSTGSYYNLPAGAVQNYNFSGSLPAANSGSLATSIAVGTGTPTALTWTYNKAYETAATQGSVQGRWNGAFGAISVLWDLDAAGKLAGTSTTGCTYTGSITPNANPVAVLDVAVTESCAGASKTLGGIATLNAAKSVLSLAYTTPDRAQGGVLVFSK